MPGEVACPEQKITTDDDSQEARQCRKIFSAALLLATSNNVQCVIQPILQLLHAMHSSEASMAFNSDMPEALPQSEDLQKAQALQHAWPCSTLGTLQYYKLRLVQRWLQQDLLLSRHHARGGWIFRKWVIIPYRQDTAARILLLPCSWLLPLKLQNNARDSTPSLAPACHLLSYRGPGAQKAVKMITMS